MKNRPPETGEEIFNRFRRSVFDEKNGITEGNTRDSNLVYWFC